MDLVVAHAAAETRHADCFVALPSAVAADLLRALEGAAGAVLRVTATSRPEPLFLAWAGASVPEPRVLALHASFADALGLLPGARVRVSLEDTLRSDAPAAASTVVLSPASYSAFGADERLPEAEYTLLCGTARFLERSALTQVRVVFPGMQFPLRLPGHGAVLLRVDAVSSVEKPAGALYAILRPESELIVAPPPRAPARPTQGPFTSASLRALCSPKRLRALFPVHVLVPEQLMPQQRAPSVTCVRVSVRPSGVSLPVAALPHDAVPQGHVFLPQHVYFDLQLAPLAPVVVERIPHVLAHAPSLRYVCEYNRRLPHSCELPLNDIFKLSAVVYAGMRVGDFVILNPDESEENLSLPVTREHCVREAMAAEPWDREWSSGKAEDQNDELVPRGPTKAQEHIRGWLSRPEQSCELVRDSADLTTTDVPAQGPLPLVSPAQQSASSEEETIRVSDLTGEFCRVTLRALFKLAKPLFSSTGAVRPRLILLEGAQGGGKTFIARSLAAILREKALARTVWIRCRVHQGEPENESVRRVERAFSAAADGGKGVLVLDDLDALVGSITSTSAPSLDVDHKSSLERRVLALAIAKEARRVREHAVVVVMTCVRAFDLCQDLRVPGLVTQVVSIPTPGIEDRAALLAELCEFRTLPNPVRGAICDVAADADGFVPRDLVVLLDRATVLVTAATKEVGDTSEDEQSEYARFASCLQLAARELTPISRAGLHFDDLQDSRMDWSRIGGLHNAKRTLREALELPSRHPSIFGVSPVRLPNGVFIYGPPGCGKTFLAKAAATVCDMRCITIKGPELLSKYIGESEAEVRRVFKRAAASAPCVLLFDEFDALAPRRGGESTGVADRVVNTLLTALDGVEKLAEGVFVIATTSRPEQIDPALLRPGRLDMWIPVDFPGTAAERLEILRCICVDVELSANANATGLARIANETDGYTAADLRGLVGDAQLCASRDGAGSVTEEMLKSALRTSRASVTASEQRRFRAVMSRFSRSKEATNHSSSSLEAASAELSGKRRGRVALQ